MSAGPLISVIIPAFNHDRFIKTALDSVARQSYSGPLEVLVVDDGSDDQSALVAAGHSLRPQVIAQSNGGAASARNRGIQESRGQWLAFLDADDQWLPNRLDQQLQAVLPLKRPALVFSQYRRIHLDGEALSGAPEHPSPGLKPSFSKLLRQNFIGTSTVLVHRQCLKRCGLFPESDELRKGQDYALWLRIAALFPLLFVPSVSVLYGVHDGNRVGIDPLEHHRAGLTALQNFVDWDARESQRLPSSSISALQAYRWARFLGHSLNTLLLRPNSKPTPLTG